MALETPNHTQTVAGWAAYDSSGKIAPYIFKRRENGVNDVTIQVMYCGVCHTDLHHVKDDWGITMYPVVPGHEITGVITKVGSDVKNFKLGDRVGVGCLAASCLECEFCKNSQENYCDQIQFTYNGIFWDGTITYGGYSDMLVADHRYVVHVPDNLPMDAAAPLLCAGITVFSPMKDCQLLESPGKKVGIVGLGGLAKITKQNPNSIKFSLGLEIHLSSFIPSHLTLSTLDPSILIVGSIFFLPFNPGLYLVTAMSPASKSKSKDKKSSKDSQKASARPSGPANAASGAPASAYNPLLGTFHTIETAPSSSASPLQSNGRFRNIDDTDEHLGGSLGAGIEFDSISNNGSWSGESEEHKEKTSNLPVRPEIIPGADNDKREKIRQKNERKHQRQKERRAQELHERCNGYLMSRKLEALAQQLVAMGFSHDRATMALIFNEGKVEESVAWLFEGSEEEAVKHKESTIGGGNLKIDISEELARIADMEIRYKCTKQEVERAVVAAEGDLEKAAESLRSSKQDPPAPAKPEETCDPAGTNKVSVAGSQNISGRPQPKPNLSPATQQRRDEKDFNYVKSTVPVGVSSEIVSKSFQPLKRIQPRLEWAKPQQSAVPAEKRWPSSGSNPSVSYSLASPLQASPPLAKTESRNVAVGSDYKKLQPSIREPVMMMQRPQSVNTKQVPATCISSSPPGTTPFLYPSSSVEITKSNGFMPHIASARSLSSNSLSSNPMHPQLYYPQQQQFSSSSSPGDSPGTSRGNGLWSRTGGSPTLAAASSLGLFTGSGSTNSSGASSPVDWSSGSSMAQLDYTNIDWSLDRTSPRPGGIWLGPTSPMKSSHLYYRNTNGLSVKPGMRLTPNVSAVAIAGLQDGGVAAAEASSTSVSHEWTSPFEGKDLFSLPRQYVSSPTL